MRYDIPTQTFDEIIERTPSSTVWQHLCETLDHMGNFELFAEQFEGRLQQHLNDWPDELRVAPTHWVERLLEGEVPLGLSLIKTLHIPGSVSETIWIKLMNHPALTHLTCLEIEGGALDDTRIRFLADTTALIQLEHLKLTQVKLGPEQLQKLCHAQAPWQRTLERLSLSRCKLTAPHLELLEETKLFAQLSALDLSKNRLDLSCVKQLLDLSHFPALRHLDLSFNHIHELGLRHLLEHPLAAHLEHLDLYANALSPRALQTLFTTTRLSALRSLSVGLNRFSPSLVRHVLPQSTLWQGHTPLQRLNIDFVQTFDTYAMEALGQQAQLHHLTHLSMSGCMLHDNIIHALAEHHDMPHLQRLELDLNAISSHGLHSLCSTHLPNLRHLMLANNAIDAHVVNVLPHAPWVPQLRHLDLRSNLFNIKTRDQLRMAPSLMLIDSLHLD